MIASLQLEPSCAVLLLLLLPAAVAKTAAVHPVSSEIESATVLRNAGVSIELESAGSVGLSSNRAITIGT